MYDGKLTEEESNQIALWNEKGLDVSNNALKHFIPSWFDNIQSLIKTIPHPQDVRALAEIFSGRESLVVLGSGPSAMKIACDLPDDDPKMLLMCGPTCVGNLLVYDRHPDIIVVADSSPDQMKAIKELDIDWEKLSEYKIAISVTADKSWYDEKSPFRYDQLYFYLPYLEYGGSRDIAYNDILHALFPEIHLYISQAGCVANVMLGIAEVLCGESSSKRVYLGVDCCGWLTEDPLLRAPSSRKLEDGSYIHTFLPRQVQQNKEESEGAIRIPAFIFDLQTNLISLGYAIQMLYIVHISTRTKDRENRFVMLQESSKLYKTLAPGETPPIMHAFEVGMNTIPLSSDEWAYNIMLKLINFSVEYYKHLEIIQEDKNGKEEDDLES